MTKEFSLINFLEKISYLENKFSDFLSSKDNQSKNNFDIEKENLINEIINEIITIVDSVEMFIESFDCNQTGEIEIVLILFKMINKFFKRFNVKQISKKSNKFNPLVHEAISIYNGSEFEKGTIRSVLQPGYIRNGVIIRPALVVVNN